MRRLIHTVRKIFMILDNNYANLLELERTLFIIHVLNRYQLINFLKKLVFDA